MKQGQGIGKRIIPLVLTIAMLFGLICTPIGQVHASAAEAPISNTPMTIAASTGPVVSDNGNGTYNVTFTYTGAANSVLLCGTLPGTTWDTSNTLRMDKNDSNIWTATVTVSEPGTYEYKYVADDNWEKEKNYSYNASDGNSFVAVGYESPIVDEENVTVKFIATNEEIMVRIAGTFAGSNWTPVDMHFEGGSVYTYSFPRSAPGTYDYKIVAVYTKDDGSEEIRWVADPANPIKASNGDDSQLTVEAPPEPTPTPTPEATPTPKPEPVDPDSIISPEIEGNKVTFRYHDKTNASMVWLAGSMTDWDEGAREMTNDGRGVWSIELTLDTGTYDYKFLVGTKEGWTIDPKNPYRSVHNDDCFVPVGYKSPVVNGSSVTVAYYNPKAQEGQIKVGGIPSWSNGLVVMEAKGNGLFEYTFEGLSTGQYWYKFVDETITSGDQYVSDPANALPTAPGGNCQFTITESTPVESTPSSPDPDPTETPSTSPDPEPTEVISPEISGNSVTFRYENADASNVWLTGSLNGWAPDLMTKNQDTGVWSITKDLEFGNYEYKFLVNDIKTGWKLDPKNPYSLYGTDGNNFVPVGYQSPSVNGSSVTITYLNTTGNSIEVAGDFTNWQFVPMNSGENGLCSATFEGLTKGPHQYKFHTVGTGDEGWFLDPACPLPVFEDNNQFQITEGPDAVDPPVEVKSPEVDGHNVTLRYKGNVNSVELMGELPGADWNIDGTPTLVQNKETGIWEITCENVPAGKYKYKFAVNSGWAMDDLNSWIEGTDNIVVVTGLRAPSVSSVKTGKTLDLPVELNLFDKSGTSTPVAVSYELKGTYDGVSINGNMLSVPESFSGTSITLTAKHGEDAVDFTVDVFTTLYTYNIYFFDWDSSHMSADAAEMWVWYNGGADAAYPFNGLEPVNGKNWLKGTVQLPVKSFGLIVRSKGDWTWQTRPDFTFDNSDGQEIRNGYVVFGDSLTLDTAPSLPDERVRSFNVPGTFPGPSWDAASNKMEVYDADRQIYSYTFEDVPAGNYEFKSKRIDIGWDGTSGKLVQ